MFGSCVTAAVTGVGAAARTGATVVPGAAGLAGAAGAALFAFSDATLAYLGMMEHKSRRLDNISLGAYFTGQFLLALALII